MGGQPIPVTRDVKPGETFDFQVNLIAPIVPGTYQGFWNLRNAQNRQFGETVWVGITVKAGSPVPPPPTQTPETNILFTADPTSITSGEPVLFKWKAEDASAVFFYHDGQSWSDHPVSAEGKSTEYPPYTQNYNLRVVKKNNEVVVRTIMISVKPAEDAPVIEYFGATPPQIVLGGCVSIDWSVSGKVDRVILLANNTPVWDGGADPGQLPGLPAGCRTAHLHPAGLRTGRHVRAADHRQRAGPSADRDAGARCADPGSRSPNEDTRCPDSGPRCADSRAGCAAARDPEFQRRARPDRARPMRDGLVDDRRRHHAGPACCGKER